MFETQDKMHMSDMSDMVAILYQFQDIENATPPPPVSLRVQDTI